MKEWTKEQIEEAEYYGISLFNKDGKPFVGDMCEICHEPYRREYEDDKKFPRYCEKCLKEHPEIEVNELKNKEDNSNE